LIIIVPFMTLSTSSALPGIKLKTTLQDYFVNHYDDPVRQETDSKMVWETPAGTQFVGPGAPTGSKPLGILYPRAGTLGGCSAHNGNLYSI